MYVSTVYTITATNSGGSDTATVTIVVNDEVPSGLTYSPNSFTLTKDVAMSTVTPTSSGGAIVSWSISPTLPTGLAFDTSNGAISGTPTVLSVSAAYTVTATNTGGSDTAAVTIVVNDAVPNIAYSPNIFSLTKGVIMSPTATPTNSGGAIPSAIIDSSGIVGSYSSVVTDSNGFSHIAYYDDTNDDLKYATDKSGTWVTSTLDHTGNVGQYTSISVDSNNYIYISYYDVTSENLKYATDKSGSWVYETLDSPGDVGKYSSIAISTTDKIHISYMDDTNDNLRYATNKNGYWAASTLDSAGLVGSYTSIALDSNNKVHISYYDSSNSDLKYVTDKNGAWSPNAVYSDPTYSGHYTSIAIDNSGNVHISFHDHSFGYLRYATCSINCHLMASWTTTLVDSVQVVGRYSSIALDSSGFPHISYYKNGGILKYAKYDGSSWTKTVLDTIGNVGQHSSISIDSDDVIHISYFDQSTGSLRYLEMASTSNTYDYSISPTLPSGLIFNRFTGEISGTSATVSASAAYTVTARNSGGTAITTVTIVVNDEVPSLYYSPDEYNFTKGVTISSTILPTNIGGTPTSYTISPNLLSIFHFGTSNGMIGGTPSITLARTQFMITATNSGGSSVAYINVTINDAVPTLSYPSSSYTIVRGYDMTDITPTSGGGTVLTWEISPSLSSGLSFTSGVISGKPFANQTAVTYTVYANNSGGSTSATFDLTINEPTPNIDYNPDNYTLTNNSAIRIDPILQANPPSAVAAITFSGNAAPDKCLIQMGDLIFSQGHDPSHGKELWAFNHTLPVSVSNPYMVKDINSGVNDGISGDCDEMLVVNGTLFFRGNDGSYGVELWKSDGTSSGTVMVKDLSSGSSNLGDFTSINDKLFFTTSASSKYRRWVSDGTNAGTYQVGLTTTNPNSNFYPRIEYNGSIYGQGWDGNRVLFSLNDTTYESVADIGGSNNNPRALTIYDGWLYFLTYSSAAGIGCLYRTNGTESGTSMFVCDTPQYSRSEIEMAVFNDELYFIRDSSGHGDELWKTDGTQSGTVMVKDIVPGSTSGFCSNPSSWCQGGFRFHATENYLLFDVDSDGDGKLELWKTDGTSGGTSMLKEISLPSADLIHYHLVGEIVYFRASQHGSYDYELWSTDGTPSGTVRAEDIRVGETGSSPRDMMDVDGTLYLIAYGGSSNSLYHVNNAANGVIGAPTTWSISPPTLPSGLNFNNGVISGTPTALQLTPLMYTITATNANGSSSTTINLTIIDTAPVTFGYNPVDMELTLNQVMTPNTVSPGGGAVTSWEISPDLPAGLNFESSNGTIWGTPTILQIDPVMYTIWANNSGGSVEVNVNITINDEAPDIEYNPDWFVLTNNTAMSPTATPTNSGGAIPSGIIAEPSQVSSTLGEGRYNSIAVDSNGVAHVVYFGGNHYRALYYATNANGSWVTTMLKHQSGITNGASIVIDSNDTIHISYSHRFSQYSTGNNLYYSTCSSSCSSASSWSGGLVVGGGYYNDIAIDTNGTLHISHYTGSSLQHSTCSSSCSTASSWTTTSVTSVTLLWEISMTTDSNNSIHILYTEGNPTRDLNYATCSSGCTSSSSWSTVELNAPSTSTTIGKQSIAVDSNNGIHITYQVDTNLTYAACSSSCTSASSWTNTTVDTDTVAYARGEIAIDSNDHLYISYAKGSSSTASNLTYATCSSSCTSSSSWTNTTFDTNGGSERSMALDSNDRVHISYHSGSTDKSLRYLAVEPSSIVYAYSISPALPAGLSLEISTGEISGTPTELSTNTTYTITVRNSGGVGTTTITIEVNDEVPTIAYSPNDLDLTNNTASSDLPLSPTITGSGEFVSWAINASLPSGLTFETSNGTIYGTPTELWTQTSYMVWANNSGGSSVAYLNITVVDEIPTIAYSPSSFTLTKDVAMSPTATPTNTGGAILSWSISPALPTGLNLDTSTGEISGTATILSPSTNYMVTAVNSGGDDHVTISIEINDVIPTISYSPNSFIETKDIAMTSVTPTSSGGAVLSWLISPPLPTGLSLDISTGEISGTPSILSVWTSYTVTATNSGGSTTTSITITVNDVIPTISYSPNSFIETKDIAMTSVTPTSSGGAVLSWSISPALPTGLNLDTSTGEISGTATILSPSTNYMVTAVNSGGDDHVTISIEINDVIPTISYSPNSFIETKDIAMTSVTPTSSGGAVLSWLISPALPTGLNLDTSTGEISGTPSILSVLTSYAVTATNSGGSTTTSITITVNDVVPTISYSPNSFIETKDVAMTSVTPTSSGGAVLSWSTSPALPTGLNLDTSTGEISGTPSILSVWTSYTVTATNSGGSTTTSITITVNDIIPTISYSPSTFILVKDDLMSPTATPTNSGGSITSWGITPTLPTGVLFDTATGEISGTPTVISPSTVYTVTALNSGGSDTTTVTITINDVLSSISYSPSSFTLTKDSPMSPTATPTNAGGVVISWAISPSLPNGLAIDVSTGEISGTPTVISSSTSYTVTATNSGGVNTAIVTIIVNDVIPTISYSPSSFILTKDSVMSPTATPANTGGTVISWAITPAQPTGLNFDTATGALSGTPTVISPSITYTVTATNSGGLDTATITIVVNDDVPTISYSPDDLNLVNNTVSSDLPLSPIITGSGVIVSWAISPSMPSGLTFSTSTGVISGTPNELLVRSQFTIIGTNTGGTSTAYVNITIVDEIPMVAYSPENLTLFNGTISSDLPLSPTITGPGDLLSWSITPSLPSGLIFSTTSGTISGIATVLQLSPVAYTITAINSGGVATSYLNITVLHESPTFTYSSYNLILENNTVMTPIVATIMGGEITSWEIDPAAPNGVLLNTDGSISGTPTVVQSISMYRVWGNNSGGYHSIYLNITIYDPVVTLEYNPENVTLTKGAVMANLVPTYDGIVDDWSVYPNLPSGLAFSNGVISGTPAVNLSRSTYTVWANNTGGPSSHMINITIIEPIAVINYSPNNREETRTISMIDWIPITSGGAIETWEISPQLPLGLTFVEGVISGVPTVNSTEIEYTVWANNSGGPTSTIIHLSIIEPIVEITYPNYELTLVRNVTMTPLVPQLTGGNAELWEIYPDLPQGLNFVDGTISGTPQVNSTRTMYTVWANNSGGSTNVSLNVTILEPSANIIYNPTNLILTRGEMMEPAEPEVSGGNIETWEIDPALPLGLEFDNGTITGTPTGNMTIQTYLVYVNNSGGPSFTAISITIHEPAPIIEYSIDNITLMRGETSLQLPLAAIFGGGGIASFTVEPALPDGLNFTNGTISGTPTVNSTTIQYTISAINNGGSHYFLLNITILEPAAIIATDSTYFELTRGESEMNLTFNNTGGMVETWTVYPDLPAGLVFGNGTIIGIPTVNASLATYKIFANNTGGSTNITINIKILEPVSSISYSTIVFNLINGMDTLSISPDVLGGNPETWEFEPALPNGITFINGMFSGIPLENLTTTTYIIWANNSGGSASTTLELTVDQPFFVVRYPVTLLVLNASQNMAILEPIYYFDEEQEPVWTVSPDLPEGLSFVNGAISGIPTVSQSLTTYEVTISGEMVPTTLFLMIEILDEYIEPIIEPANNLNNYSSEIPTDLEPIPDEEPDEILYWLFPLLIILCLWLFAMIYNLKNRDDESDLAQSLEGALENEGK